MRSLFTTTLVVMLSIGSLSQVHVPRPDAAGNPSNATPTTSIARDKDAAGCGSLATYDIALNKAFAGAGTFSKVLTSSTLDYSTITQAEGKRIVQDGSALIANVEKLNVPPMYADGGKGIVLLLTFLNQEVSFYTVDSSTVPDMDSFSKSGQLIHDGETQAARECPAEVKKLGSYIFIDPTQIDPGM